MNKNIDITGIELHTKRLMLRPWSMNDLDDFFAYASIDGVGQMAGWFPHQNIEESKKILKMFIDGKKTFAIVLDGRAVGSIGIEEYDEKEFPEFAQEKVREIGFVLAKEYWGRGLMPEAAEEVIRWLFEEVQLDRILCGHFLNNQQSKRVQMKCGFVPYRVISYQTRMGTAEQTMMSFLTKEQWQDRCMTQKDKSSV